MSDKSNIPERFSGALSRVRGNVQLLREMAAVTTLDLPAVIARTRESVQAGDCVKAATELHQLKGMLSTFEIDGVTLRIQEIIDAAHDRDASGMQRVYGQHATAIDDLVTEISQLAE